MSAGTYSAEGRLGALRVRGGRVSADLAESTTAASLSLSSSEVTQLDLTVVDDEDLTVLESRVFDPGTPTKAGSRCDFGGLDLEVRAVEVGPRGADHTLRVTARSYGVGQLRRRTGGLVRKKLSPTQFAKLEATRAGLKFVGQPSAKRKAIARQGGKDPETSWDTLQRLATELGFLCFEAAGALYFGKPTWIVTQTARVVVAWKGKATGDGIDALPVCRRSGDDKRAAATVDVTLRGDYADTLLPGMGLELRGVPTFEGLYMIDTVTVGLAENAGVRVTASTPVNPTPQPPPKRAKTSPGRGATAAAGATTTAAATGSGSAGAFVATALAQLGDSYVLGAEAAISDPNPNAFDCSELVEWAAGRVGVSFPGTSGTMIAACIPLTVEAAIATRGALLWHEGHIAISLGNGQTIEAANPGVGVVSYNAAGRFARGGKIPGMRY